MREIHLAAKPGQVLRRCSAALIRNHHQLTRPAGEIGAMQGLPDTPAREHRDARIAKGSLPRARNQQDFVSATPCRGTPFRPDGAIAAKPYPMPVFDECPFPSESGCRPDRAAEFGWERRSEERRVGKECRA